MKELKPAEKDKIINEINEIMDGYKEGVDISSKINLFMSEKSAEK